MTNEIEFVESKIVDMDQENHLTKRKNKILEWINKRLSTCPIVPLNGPIFPLNNSNNFVAGSIVVLVKTDRLSRSLFLQACWNKCTPSPSFDTAT